MKVARPLIIVAVNFVFSIALFAQSPVQPATVPVTLDHNRIVIDVYVPLKDGTKKRVRGLVDTGSTSLMLSQRVVKLTGGSFTCEGQSCLASAPAEIQIGAMTIPLAGAGMARMLRRPEDFSDAMIPGMSPEVLIPAPILKNYDVTIDYANRQFTIGPPGSVKFSGTRIPINTNDHGLITVSSELNGKSCAFGLDTGLTTSLTDSANLTQWHKAQPAWPYTAGILGAANMTGGLDELKGASLRVPALQLGAASLHDVMVASNDKAVEAFDGKTPNLLSAILGGEAFKGTRIGIDYAHNTLYLEQINNSPTAAGLDVIGLTLRPEVDGRFTVVAIVPYEGQPSVPEVKAGDVLVGVDGAPVTGATMGQVWSLLGGDPGQTRKLIIERDGKRLTMEATVRRFLSLTAR
jgi:hypothetical protein